LRRHNLLKVVGLGALAVVLCVLPFRVGGYNVGILTILFINIIMVVSFRLIVTMGNFSLAHVVLMGAGAYTSALLTREVGWPFWAALPMGGLVAALVALLMSYPLVRMKGFAFFIGSYAAGEAIRLSWLKLRYPFGGASGIIKIPHPDSISVPGLPTIDFANPISYYFLALVVTGVCVFLMYRVDRSRLAENFRAIYSQDILASCVGINITRYKTIAFVIGSFFAGIAGVLLAHFNGTIDPYLFAFTPMMFILIWVVVGGTHTFIGPIIGVTLFTGVEERLRVLAEWRPLFYGIVLIVVLLFLPGGFESLPEKIRPLARRLRSRLGGE